MFFCVGLFLYDACVLSSYKAVETAINFGSTIFKRQTTFLNSAISNKCSYPPQCNFNGIDKIHIAAALNLKLPEYTAFTSLLSRGLCHFSCVQCASIFSC